MSTSEIFLVAMTIILALPYLFWRLLRTDYYAPLVVVQIVAGILLGPGMLGAAYPEYYRFVFNPQVVGALNGIAWWAVMMFVWSAGLELDLHSLWADRRDAGITAACALVTPLALGCAAAGALLALGGGWIGARSGTWQFVLGLGMACAVTALPILVLFMERLAILDRPLGQRVLRYASLDDVAIWGVLAFILLDWARIARQGGFLVAFTIAAFAVRRLLLRLPEADRWYVGLIWLALTALGADWAGFHFMVGAFLAGAVLDASMFERARLEAFRRVVLLTIMPIFFLSTGLRTRWEVGGLAVFGAAALLLVAAVAGKLLGVRIAAQLLRWREGEAWVVGWLLQTKALIMIIFANILLDKGVITSEAFTALLLMAVASTMLSIPMVAPRIGGMRHSS